MSNFAKSGTNANVARCRCPDPRRSPNPRKEGTCLRCDHKIESGPKLVSSHLDRLAESLYHYGPDGALLTDDSFDAFRRLVENRVQMGEELYGDEFRTKDDIIEALEEAADLTAYSAWSTNGRDRDLSLTAAYHAFRAAEALWRLRGKQRGAP